MVEIAPGILGMEKGGEYAGGLLNRLLQRKVARQTEQRAEEMHPLNVRQKKLDIERLGESLNELKELFPVKKEKSEQELALMNIKNNLLNRYYNRAKEGNDHHAPGESISPMGTTTQQPAPEGAHDAHQAGTNALVNRTPDVNVMQNKHEAPIPDDEEYMQHLQEESGFNPSAGPDSEEGKIFDLLAGLEGKPVHKRVVDGVEYTDNPYIGTRSRKVASNPYQQERMKKAANTVSDLETHYLKSQPLREDLNQINQILQTREWKNLYAFPYFRGAQLQSLQGNPKVPDETKKLIGRMITAAGDIVQQAAERAHGQFRVGQQKNLEQLKVNPSDNPLIAQGKMQVLARNQQLQDLMDKKIPELVDKYNITPGQAYSALNRKYKFNQYEQQLSKKAQQLAKGEMPKAIGMQQIGQGDRDNATDASGFDFSKYGIRGG